MSTEEKNTEVIKGNERSKAFLLGFLANITSNYHVYKKSNLEKQSLKIAKALEEKEVIQFAGNWKVVAGPFLKTSEVKHKYHAKKHVVDNLLYVAQSMDDRSQFIIGIAGTNGISSAGWFDQDFKVDTTVKWPPQFLDLPDMEAGSISTGGSNGLKNLWTTKDKSGKTLWSFIEKIATQSSITLSIAGHSLGGSLAPILGAAIADSLEYAGLLNMVTVKVFPTAGPTPGDEGFATHLASKSDYLAIYNQNDIVPLSWNFETKELQNLKDAYARCQVGDKKINPNNTITKNMLDWAEALPGKHQYAREPKPCPATFKTENWSNPCVNPTTEEKVNKFAKLFSNKNISSNLEVLNGKAPLTDNDRHNLARFFIEAGYQHVAAYGNPSSKEHVNLDFPACVQIAIKPFFHKIGKYDLWLYTQLVNEFAQLTKMAAEWFSKKHSLDLSLPEIEITEAEMMAEFEENFGSEGQGLSLIGPFSQWLEADTEQSVDENVEEDAEHVEPVQWGKQKVKITVKAIGEDFVIKSISGDCPDNWKGKTFRDGHADFVKHSLNYQSLIGEFDINGKELGTTICTIKFASPKVEKNYFNCKGYDGKNYIVKVISAGNQSRHGSLGDCAISIERVRS